MKNYTKIKIPKKYCSAIKVLAECTLSSGSHLCTKYVLSLKEGFCSGKAESGKMYSFETQKDVMTFIRNIDPIE